MASGAMGGKAWGVCGSGVCAEAAAWRDREERARGRWDRGRRGGSKEMGIERGVSSPGGAREGIKGEGDVGSRPRVRMGWSGGMALGQMGLGADGWEAQLG